MPLNYNGKTYLEAIEAARTQEEENEVQIIRNTVIEAINNLKETVLLPDGKEGLVERANKRLADHGFGLKRISNINRQGELKAVYAIEAWDPVALK